LITKLNSEDRLVQKTFADHLEHELGWESVYAWDQETFGRDGTLGRDGTRRAVAKSVFSHVWQLGESGRLIASEGA